LLFVTNSLCDNYSYQYTTRKRYEVTFDFRTMYLFVVRHSMMLQSFWQGLQKALLLLDQAVFLALIILPLL